MERFHMSFKIRSLKIHRMDESLYLSFALWYLMLDNGRVADLSKADRELLARLQIEGYRRQDIAVSVHYLALLVRVLGGELILRFWTSDETFREAVFLRNEQVFAQLISALSMNRTLPADEVAAIADPDVSVEQLFALAEPGGSALQILIAYQNELLPTSAQREGWKDAYVEELGWRSARVA
jgi:hypothetical protein